MSAKFKKGDEVVLISLDATEKLFGSPVDKGLMRGLVIGGMGRVDSLFGSKKAVGIEGCSHVLLEEDLVLAKDYKSFDWGEKRNTQWTRVRDEGFFTYRRSLYVKINNRSVRVGTLEEEPIDEGATVDELLNITYGDVSSVLIYEMIMRKD